MDRLCRQQIIERVIAWCRAGHGGIDHGHGYLCVRQGAHGHADVLGNADDPLGITDDVQARYLSIGVFKKSDERGAFRLAVGSPPGLQLLAFFRLRHIERRTQIRAQLPHGKGQVGQGLRGPGVLGAEGRGNPVQLSPQRRVPL